MKFTTLLLATFTAQTAAFAPTPFTRSHTGLCAVSEIQAQVAQDGPKASSAADDLEKTLSVIMDHLEKKDSGAGIDDSDDDTPYVPPTPPPAPKAAAPAAAPAKSSTGIELWSVDYDAAAMLAYKAAGSNGDFAAFKTQYLADTSAMVGKKNPYKK